MVKKIAINGFGRIGRLTFKHLLKDTSIKVVAINDLTDKKTLAHLLQYDSVGGKFFDEIKTTPNGIKIKDYEIEVFTEKEPDKLPWKALDIDLVLECTGKFKEKDKAALHLKAGAKKVILSAPSSSNDVKMIVLGINDHLIETSDKIISNASCTTNCLAPIAKIINDEFGFRFANMTTTHAYTADQRLQDAPHRDLRRARAAAINMIPTSTNGGIATGVVLPELANKINAIAVRVPVPAGSLIDLNVMTDRNDLTSEEVNKVIRKGIANKYAKYVSYSEAPLVSSDIVGNTYSAIFDSKMTTVTQGQMIRIIAWYDNEAGYSARLAELANRF